MITNLPSPPTASPDRLTFAVKNVIIRKKLFECSAKFGRNDRCRGRRPMSINRRFRKFRLHRKTKGLAHRRPLKIEGRYLCDV